MDKQPPMSRYDPTQRIVLRFYSSRITSELTKYGKLER